MAEIIDGKAIGDGVAERVGRLAAELTAAGRPAAGPGGGHRRRGPGQPGLCRLEEPTRPRSAASIRSSTRCRPRPRRQTCWSSSTRSTPTRRSTASWSSCRCRPTSMPARVIQTIAPEKDVDGFHFVNVGKLGTGELETAFVPCTPAGAMLLIERVRGKDLSGLECGRRRPLQHRRQADGQPLAGRQLHRHHRPQPHAATCRPSPAAPTSWSPPSAGPRWSRATG